jgi:hypothetical protein
MHTVRARRAISAEVVWIRQRYEVFRLSLPTPFSREKKVATSRPVQTLKDFTAFHLTDVNWSNSNYEFLNSVHKLIHSRSFS